MIVAWALIAVIVLSVLFHILSPWHATPLASNWGSIDTTITITLVITAIFFVLIGLFMAYCVYRYRAGNGEKAHYEPENKKLEWWLISVTTVGICALLAPGLVVYGKFIDVPEGAKQVEAVGEQWRWSFRMPGADDVFGKTGVSHISFENPFGIDPGDPAGQDDILVPGSELHLAINEPVKILLRSKDVLHDFYVPEFRARMDLIPGQVTHFWFTPTRAGGYDILCAELCGVGHFNMRGRVVVEDAVAYADWLAARPTFAASISGGGSEEGLVAQGRKLAESQGCMACHSVDGSKSLGPGWQDLFGKTESLTGSAEVVVDAAYIRESIAQPGAKIVEGYPNVMVSFTFSEQQLDAIVAYIKSLSAGSSQDAAGTTGSADAGKQLAGQLGCTACHSADGSRLVGPSWLNLFGRTEILTDGTSVQVDDTYLKNSIIHPAEQVVEGYPPVMQAFQLPEHQLTDLVAYIRSLANDKE